MMKRDIEVIVIKGEFTKNIDSKDIIVQEYTGDMLLLQDDHLLNIRKDGDPFNLTDYIENYIKDNIHNGLNHLVIKYVNLPNALDAIDPVKIRQVCANDSLGSLYKKHEKIIELQHNNDISKTFNDLDDIYDYTCVYMEIYAYYNEN